MEDINKKIKNINNLRITAEKDSFELFEEYATRKKRKRINRFVISVGSVAAVLVLLLVFRGMTGQISITDIYNENMGLCATSFIGLQEKGYRFHEVLVDDDCLDDCSFCERGKWFEVDKIQGLMIQRSVSEDEISRVRFTKEYKGILPNVSGVSFEDIHSIKDLAEIYPMWYAEHCSDYTSFSQGDLRILVKSKNAVEAGLVDVNNSEFSEMQIEVLEIFNSCLNN